VAITRPFDAAREGDRFLEPGADVEGRSVPVLDDRDGAGVPRVVGLQTFADRI
jgi:hypothetical protein